MDKLKRFSETEWLDFIFEVYSLSLRNSCEVTKSQEEVDIFIAQLDVIKDVTIPSAEPIPPGQAKG